MQAIDVPAGETRVISAVSSYILTWLLPIIVSIKADNLCAESAAVENLLATPFLLFMARGEGGGMLCELHKLSHISKRLMVIVRFGAVSPAQQQLNGRVKKKNQRIQSARLIATNHSYRPRGECAASQRIPLDYCDGNERTFCWSLVARCITHGRSRHSRRRRTFFLIYSSSSSAAAHQSPITNKATDLSLLI